MIKTAWRRIGFLALPLAAVLIALARPPFHFSYFTFVALVPWLAVLRRAKNSREALLAGLLVAILTTLLNDGWVAVGMRNHFHVNPWLAWGGLVILGAINQLHLVVFSWAGYWVLRRGWPSTIFWALLYVGIDGIIPHLHYDPLGNLLYPFSELKQIADLGGMPMLTLLILLVNLSVWRALEDRSLIRLLPGALAIIAAFSYGTFRNSQFKQMLENSSEKVHVRVIQANVHRDTDSPNAVPLPARGVGSPLEQYLSVSAKAAAKSGDPELLVWPESSNAGITRVFNSAPFRFYDQELNDYLSVHQNPLIFGAVDSENGQIFNSVFLANAPSMSPPQIYHKNYLLPLGEKSLGVMLGMKKAKTELQTEEKYRILEVKRPNGKTLRISPLICFESIIPGVAMRGARLGSDLIISLNNDSWFKGSIEPELHLIGSAFRSIETRQPQIIAAETGISALVLPDGSIARQTRQDMAEVMDVDVPLFEIPPPVAVFVAPWISLVAFILGAGGFLFQLKKKGTSTEADSL